MEFKPGQPITCIDASGTTLIELGKVYCVSNQPLIGRSKLVAIDLKEQGSTPFYEKRFIATILTPLEKIVYGV